MRTHEIASLRCPYCQQSRVEATARTAWVRGFLLAYQTNRQTLVGCVPCVRRELLMQAGKSALLGWFSITAFITNPFLILYNLARGVSVRANPRAVARRLTELGFVPLEEGGVDIRVASYSLAAALMASDGKVDPTEVHTALRLGQERIPGFDADEFRRTCGSRAKLPGVTEAARLLAPVLDEEQRRKLVDYLAAIAQADSEMTEEEARLLRVVTEILGVEEPASAALGA